MNVIEIKNVTKKFGDVQAVDRLSLNVPRGAIYGFIGPNGSGKTTTLRLIMNIFYPDSGAIRVFGEEMRSASTSRIGYLPEERGLYKKMKVRDLIRFYGELKSGRESPGRSGSQGSDRTFDSMSRGDAELPLRRGRGSPLEAELGSGG